MTEHKVTIIEGQTRRIPPRRLYRSTTNRSVAGVCAGLAEYLSLDVGLVRLLWLLSLLFSFGASLFLYILLAIIIPEEPADYAATKASSSSELWQHIKEDRSLMWGVILLLAGLLLLLNNFGLLPISLGQLWNLFWALFWPLLLIGLGVALLLGLNGRSLNWARIRQLSAGLPFRRSRSDRVIAGVCGGLGQYLNIDPVLIRLLWALFTLFTMGTVGVILYVLAALLIPPEDPSQL